MSKTFFVVMVNGDYSDTHAAETLAGAVELANADPDSDLKFGTVEASDAGAARLMLNRVHTRMTLRRVCGTCSAPMSKGHDCKAEAERVRAIDDAKVIKLFGGGK